MSVNNISYVEVKNCLIDKLHIRESTSNIDLSSNVSKTWQVDTYLLADFANTLEAGNITLSGLTIDKFRIRKRRVDSTKIQDLGYVSIDSNNDLYFLDTAVRPNVMYEWQVSPMSGDIEGQPVIIQTSIDFYYWWISDDTESYPIFANLEVSDIAINKQRYVYDNTFNQYPTVSYGNQQYKSGTINAMLIDTFLKVSVVFRNKFINFLNNGKPKILRTDDDILKIDTHSSTLKLYTELTEPVSSVSFSFMEIGKIEGEET